MVEAVTVDIPYTPETGEKLVNETFGPNNIRRRKTGADELKSMIVSNGRLVAERLSLDEQGFIFVEHKTKVADFFDAEQLKSVYYLEVEQLIKSTSGAARVVIFDHTLRSGDQTEREAKLIREPVLSAHNDYTEWSGPNRLREILPDEAESLLERRFAIIQVWRAINQPIQSNPLAVADAKSVALDDFLIAERRYPHRVGQTYRLKYNPNHRWFYFPEMSRDEALVFKVYDSETDGRARFTPHTSFKDPASPADARPRQSIEMRAFAFF
ncbi:MAG TPA: CmcJ/NvfI family oxidoreductase [Candidatus Polarisedimenticolaceae bacterium]|nr:CmcJ/NvfI family oxidoreductase [Candidatus Polarisedimenticolaceae bacterium]